MNDHQDERLHRIRHSAAHVMAEAVLELFPGAKIGIGPAIADGFYYDFDLPRPLTPEDLEIIEQRMREIIKGGYPFERKVVTPEEAREIFKDQPYKLELIEGLVSGRENEDGEVVQAPAQEITIYRHHNFTDLCKGPHVEKTSDIPIDGFKLLKTAGAYWRGDERNPQLQRIYGTAWLSKEELDAYLQRLEEIERRDHRRLGKQLDIYSIDLDIGPGLVLWHPNGAIIRHEIETFWRNEHLKRGYSLVYTPHIASERIYEISGHLEAYADMMYAPMEIEGRPYRVKPMNCPGHIKIFKSQLRSYRDLPIRYAELGTVYRFERSGVLHGLLRVRGFTQDDAHIFCRPDQLQDEIGGVLDLIEFMMSTFGYRYKAYLSTRPEKYIGTDEQWEFATEKLRAALEQRDKEYEVDEGGGVFYGPKIDIKLWDALGREWQGPTLQLDLNLPERFDVNYIGEDGKEHRVIILHRAVLGSMERFIGGLLEHYAGAFPPWLAPVQAIFIPIADRHNAYCHARAELLRQAGLRAQVDDSSERMSAKIRQAQLQKVPYMLVVGDREMEAGAVAVRLRSGEDLGSVPFETFQQQLTEAVRSRRFELWK
jgi:threonyl-tRNA synthetase